MLPPMRRPCPVDIAIDICSERWTLQILHQLMSGPKRYGQLLDSLDGISKRTLSARLKQLIEKDVIKRTEFKETPPRVEYSLTELGEKFDHVFDAMTFWGSSYVKYHLKVSKKLGKPTRADDFIE